MNYVLFISQYLLVLLKVYWNVRKTNAGQLFKQKYHLLNYYEYYIAFSIKDWHSNLMISKQCTAK